jgi:hypothetical protein
MIELKLVKLAIFEFLPVAVVKIQVCFVMTLCKLANNYQHFEGAWGICLQGPRSPKIFELCEVYIQEVEMRGKELLVSVKS